MFGRKEKVNLKTTKYVTEAIDSAGCDSPDAKSSAYLPVETFIRRDEIADCFDCGSMIRKHALELPPVYVDDLRPSRKTEMTNEMVSIGKVYIDSGRERHYCRFCRPAYDIIRLESDTKARYFCFPKPAPETAPANGLVEVTVTGRPLPKKRTTRRRR